MSTAPTPSSSGKPDHGYAALRTAIARWRDDRVAFVKESHRCDPEGFEVVVDPAQESILRAVDEHDKVVVRSAHGVGKTTTAAWLTEHWLATRKPSLVVTLAGTWNHLEDKLWPEIHQWGQKWKLAGAFDWQTLGIYSTSNPAGWRAVPSSSDRAPAVEGFHSPNLLLIIDEAKFLPDEIWDAIRGALTQVSRSGQRPKVVVLSTPPLIKAGWYVDLFGQKSAGWKTIHISGLDSPRVSKEWAQEIERDYGPESAMYLSKVLGEIPEGGAGAVVELRWIEASMKLAAVPIEKDRRRAVITCDVAREGEDLSVVGKIHRAKFTIEAWRATNDTMELAGMCRKAVVASDAEVLVIDDTGVGGGVTDRCREMQREKDKDTGRFKFPPGCTIIPIKFGASADRDDRFHSKKDELYWSSRDTLKKGLLALPTDHEIAALQLPRGFSLKAQLSAAIYEEDSQSRIRVLDKRVGNSEKTKTLPTKSPDLAHALILGPYHWHRLKPDETVPRPRTPTELFEQQIRDAMKQRHRNHKKPTTSYPGRSW